MEFIIRILKSSEMNVQEIDDFIFVQREVFPKANMLYEDFKLKFLDNIYGDSYIVLAYNEGVVAGARAFWRNDIDGKTAYQPSDTAVRKDFRRQGLFVKMTTPLLELLTNDEIIYNYPNGNSYPQYMKLGWEDYRVQYTRVFTPIAYHMEETLILPSDYFFWWVKPHLNEKYGYTKIMGKYYLVRKLSDHGRYIVFGEIEKECTQTLPRRHPLMMVYQSTHCPVYNRGRKIACNIVYRAKEKPKCIPGWKTDVY